MSVAPIFISDRDLTLRSATTRVSFKTFVSISSGNLVGVEEDFNVAVGTMNGVGNGGTDGRPSVSRIV